MILPLLGKTPQIGEGSFIAPSADLIGDVRLGKRCSVWFNVTLRGDVMPIVVGDETNIQDNTVFHGTHKKCGATVGSRVTIGHSVILHGCTIGDKVLIGMGTVIMDQANIPSRSIIGAGSLVTENATFPDGHLILGRPGKAVRPLNEKELAFLDKSADNYLEYMSWYPPEMKSPNP
ncbi:MAG TPA: gamma carbonic anhydrase family protein [Bdellovibrionales bacterium]|nr:gamma carbonic anhydrase family protein [Bdellovibrionales bacterium]